MPRRDHAAWHKLFENFPGPQILVKFKEFHAIFSSDPTDEELCVHGVVTNQRQAWKILFRDMTLEQMLETINNTWLDPAYKFVIRQGGTFFCVWRRR